MKNIILLVLIRLASLAYNPSAAVSYARKYCKNYNPQYSNYASLGGDCAHFVSLVFSGSMRLITKGSVLTSSPKIFKFKGNDSIFETDSILFINFLQ